jgi:hypothetical protein
MQYVITIMQHYKIGIPGLQSLNHPAMKINLKQDGIYRSAFAFLDSFFKHWL